MCNLTDGYVVVKWVGGPKQPSIPVCNCCKEACRFYLIYNDIQYMYIYLFFIFTLTYI